MKGPRLALLLVALAAISGCGSSESRVSAAGVSLHPPKGWTFQPGPTGLVVTGPAGARFDATAETGGAPDASALVHGLQDASTEQNVNPTSTTVDGHPAVELNYATTVGGQQGITKDIFVALGAGQSYSFRETASVGAWPGAKPMFDDMLASVRIDLKQVPSG